MRKFRFWSMTASCALMVLLLNPAQMPAQARGGDGTVCEGDVNADGQVDLFDLIEVISNWGECPAPCPADLNGDGVVDVQDLLVVIHNFGPCDGPGCTSPADCDDNDPCTFDLCIHGVCHHFQIPGCK